MSECVLLVGRVGWSALAVERMERAVEMFEEMGLAEAERARRELGRLRKRLAEEEDHTSP